MAGDPLRDVLQKVVDERRDQIARLGAQLKATFDPIAQDDLQKQIHQLQSELIAAEQALNQPAPAPQAPVQEQPRVETPRATDPQLLAGDQAAPAPKALSKAALEAQIRELSTQLLEAAHAVDKGGASPNPNDVAHLKQVREKLQTAMQQIGGTDIAADLGELPPRPTPSQLAEADSLIKRSMLEKRRGNTRAAGDLLRQAADVAPGSPTVLEALGDDILERGQPKPAAEIYLKALRLQPNNTNIERKYAAAIGRAQGALSVEEALQRSLGDSPLSAAEAASGRAAAIFSFFIPGSGQIILGDYVKGIVYLVLWLAMITWIKFMHEDMSNLMDSVLGKKSSFNPVILVPVIGVVAVAIVAAFTCKKSGGENVGSLRQAKGSRPAPPVDLPFE